MVWVVPIVIFSGFVMDGGGRNPSCSRVEVAIPPSLSHGGEKKQGFKGFDTYLIGKMVVMLGWYP